MSLNKIKNDVLFNFVHIYFLKNNPEFFSRSLSLGMVLLPIPCKARISFSLHVDNNSKVVIPSLSNALMAGAPIFDKKLSLGFLSSPQIGQVGQSELLKN